ncbi:MAG: OmpA family protein [Hyphomicrobiaceae bacterium]
MISKQKAIAASALVLGLSVSAVVLGSGRIADLQQFFLGESSATPPSASSTATAVSQSATAIASLTGSLTAQPSSAKSASAFDVVRIDPQGTSVFAGRSHANETINVLADGVVVGSAKADADGNWVIVSEGRPIRPNARLTLKSGPIATSPPQVGRVRVASAEPAPGKRQTANDVNNRMLSKLQGLVDQSRRAQTEPVPAMVRPATEQASAPPATKALAAEPAPQMRTPAAPTKVAAAAEAARTISKPVANKPASLPVPIQFVFREATFTPYGEKAVQLLLEYLKLNDFAGVTLTGHADDRGTEGFNMRLSRQRLDAVNDYLRDHGYRGKLHLIAKGKSEPFTGIDRTKFSREELFQLDRRVELHLGS